MGDLFQVLHLCWGQVEDSNSISPLLPTEDFNIVDKTPVFRTGSPIHIEARVAANPNVSPKIYVDECYGAHSKHLSHSRRVYVIVNNRGSVEVRRGGC